MRRSWLAALCLVTSTALAQESQVKKAEEALDAFADGQEAALADAIEAVERASVHKKTAEKGSVWVLKGRVLTIVALQGGVPEPQQMEDAVAAWEKAVQFGAGEGAISEDLERILNAAQTAIRDDLEAKNNEVAWDRVQAAILARDLLKKVGWGDDRVEAPLLRFSAMAGLRMGELERAIQWYNEMEAMAEPAPSLAVLIARTAYSEEGMDAAQAFLKPQRDKDAKNPILLEAHVTLLVQDERMEDAIAEIDAVTELETASPGEALLLGQLNVLTERPEQAEAAFARALERNPEMADAWLPMAKILLEHESNRARRAEAIEWLEKAKNANEVLDAEVVKALAEAYRRSRRASDAEELEKALQSQVEAEQAEATMAP